MKFFDNFMVILLVLLGFEVKLWVFYLEVIVWKGLFDLMNCKVEDIFWL